MRIATIILLAAAAVARADDKDEVKKLEGSWEVVSVTAGGRDLPKDKAPNLTIKDGKMTGFGWRSSSPRTRPRSPSGST